MTFRSYWLALLAITTLGAGGAAGAADSPFDVLSYALRLDLSFDESPPPDSPWRGLFSVLNTLEGEAEITVRNASDAPLAEVPLLLNRMMKATEVRVQGRPATFTQRLAELEGAETHHVRMVSVSLEQPLASGRQLRISLRYGGQLVGYPETGMLYVRETLDPDFTILRSETFCYPHVVPPRGDAVDFVQRHDRFDQRLEISVPEGHVVVTGGRSTGIESRNDRRVYSFESYEAASTIMAAVAPYRVVESSGHRIYHFAESGDGVEKLARKMDDALALYSAWFGPRRLKRGLVIAEIPRFFGSQAGPLIIQTSDAFNDPSEYGQFYHELSHLWNAPDVDAEPSRWNEGLAIFLQALVEERLGNEGSLDDGMSRAVERLRRGLEEDDRVATIAMADYGREDMTDYSYATGALMFGLLHSVVGERRLLGFLGRYYQDAYEVGSTDRDFVDRLGVELGDRAAAITREWFSTTDFGERLAAAEDWPALRRSYVPGT